MAAEWPDLPKRTLVQFIKVFFFLHPPHPHHHWLLAPVNYWNEASNRLQKEVIWGSLAHYSYGERLCIKQIYDKANVSPGQIFVCTPPRPSPLCIKQSDIWKRAEDESEQMKGGAGSELAAEPSGWKTQVSMNISLRKSQEYLQGKQMRKYEPCNVLDCYICMSKILLLSINDSARVWSAVKAHQGFKEYFKYVNIQHLK